ncbi:MULTISPECIES: PEP/pyruvate-binding domain-containing protein [unclassified Streptosporangium]|uniref:PEP/pyruvate-binding domain-containing protein n=1 Tax=unclassified Streptosporangium TaxID=2632669 RepID=UPI002E2C9387|nr:MULTISPECIES: PEP/pyruvate-binding domain-containing protein [unclassified Streptosporangium]
MAGTEFDADEGIHWLGTPASLDRAIVGEGIACLARLRDAFPVAPAFCVSAPPFEVFPRGALGPWRDTLSRAYHRLGEVCGLYAPSVEVRSLLVEPPSVPSWVGRPWTFLNVSGEEAVGQAVTECLAPFFSDRARALRRRYGWPESVVREVIFIRRFNDSRSWATLSPAGAFTGRPGDIKVRAGWGLHEQSVGRPLPADEFIVSARRVAHSRIALKRDAVVADIGGVQEFRVPSMLHRAAAVPEPLIHQMADLYHAVAARMGEPASLDLVAGEAGLEILWCEPPADPPT